MDLLIQFDDLKAGNKALKGLVQAFTRAGANVASVDIEPKTKRSSGINYRTVDITFTDNQKVTLAIKQSGDIYQIKVNGALLPIKNQDNQVKAVGEVAAALDAGRAKFQQKLARQKAILPQGITTAAPKVEESLQAAEAALDTEIAAALETVNGLREELGMPLGKELVLDTAESNSASGAEIEETTEETAPVLDESAQEEVIDEPVLDSAEGETEEITPVLDTVDIPTDSMSDADVQAAQQIAANVIKGETLDAAQVENAIATLEMALDTVETNMPANLADDNIEQADRDEKCAEQFREALKLLKAA